MPTVVTYVDAFPVTKSDTDKFMPATGGKINALYIGGAGNVAVRTLTGRVITFTAVPVGTILPIQCERVMSTNTTATLIIGLR
jgi:hypothetical protein